MRTIWSTLWLRTRSVRAQIANETHLCTEESWTVKRRNGGSSSWCGCAFFKFLAQLSGCVSSAFTEFRSTFDNVTPLVSVMRHIFQAIRGDTKSFPGDLQCVLEAVFYGLHGSTCPETVRLIAVSSGSGDLPCGERLPWDSSP